MNEYLNGSVHFVEGRRSDTSVSSSSLRGAELQEPHPCAGREGGLPLWLKACKLPGVKSLGMHPGQGGSVSWNGVL